MHRTLATLLGITLLLPLYAVAQSGPALPGGVLRTKASQEAPAREHVAQAAPVEEVEAEEPVPASPAASEAPADASSTNQEAMTDGSETPIEELPAEEEPAMAAPDPAFPEGSMFRPEITSDFVIDLDKIKLDRFYEMLEVREPEERLPISLLDAVRLALQYNQDIEIAELDPLSLDGNILAAKGIFDPNLTGSAQYSEATIQASAQTVVFGGISSVESYTTDLRTGLDGLLPWGTRYQVSLVATDEESTFNQFIEEWSGGLTLSLTQPLLRGRGRFVNTARIRIAENSRLASESSLKLSVMSTVADVVRAYWDLVGAIENLRVRMKSVENAERLLDITQKRLDIGTAAPLDVLQAQAGLATRQSDLISARAQVSDAGDLLKRLLNIQSDGILSAAPLVPTDRPSPAAFPLNLDESIALALEHRPELETATINIENAQIEARRARNDMLPQIDIGGSVTSGGRGHYPRDVYDGIREARDNSFTVSINGSLPLRNRAARGAYHSARIGEEEAELQYEKLRQDLVLNVRRAVRGVDTSRVLVESTRQTRLVQETNLAAEEQRLKLGLTTNYRVLEVEEDLTNAEVQELQSLINLEKALVDLSLAEGVLLDSLGVDFLPPEPRRPIGIVRSIIPFEF